MLKNRFMCVILGVLWCADTSIAQVTVRRLDISGNVLARFDVMPEPIMSMPGS